MSEPELPSYKEIASQIDRLRLGVDAAEVHGGLCGLLSGGGIAPTRSDWIARVMADDALDAIETESALDRMFIATVELMESPDFAFDLLLPDLDLPLNERGDALISWCRGFLAGFGLAAGSQAPLSEESRDALTDLARMAATELSYEDPESDEQALQEVAEYVRVAALLLHSDCVLAPRHRRTLN